MKKSVSIAGRELRKYQNMFVIAEVASSHEGNVETAIKLLWAAKEAGADAVKFQVFRARELLIPDHPKYPSFEEIQMSPSEWERIYRECNSAQLPFIAEVFDEESLNFMEQLNVCAYKVHSTDLTNPLLLEKVASTGKTLLLSSGGSTLEEIRYAIRIAELKFNQSIILMHGFQGFPTKLDETYLSDIPRLEEEFAYPIGYADHCDANMELAMILPLIAMGLGACVIEKHITPNRALKGRDYYSALNPDEFKHMVSLIKEVEKTIGEERLSFTEGEEAYRKLMKKSIVAASNIQRGEEISLKNIAFKRTKEPGLQPREYTNLVGKKARNDIRGNNLITHEDVCQ